MAQQTVYVPRVWGGTLILQITVTPPPAVPPTPAQFQVRDGLRPLVVRDGVMVVKGR